MDNTPVFEPDLYIIPKQVMKDRNLRPLDKEIFAIVYWLDKMNPNTNQGCFASNKTIAKIVGSSTSGVANGLVRLNKAGHIQILTDDNNHRVSMKAMVFMSGNQTLDVGGGYSNEYGGVTHMSNRTNNTKNNIYVDSASSKKDNDADKEQIDKLYLGYLINFVIDKDDYHLSSKERRLEILDKAKNKYRLTEKRRAKVASRLKDAGYDMIKQAIINCSKSDFHRGDSEKSNGWKAGLDWICNSYEKVEEWANRNEQS